MSIFEWANVRYATPNKSASVYASEFKIKLNSSERYIIALDQSTSCTGMAIFKVNTGIIMAAEFERTGVSKAEYQASLNTFLRNLMQGKQIQSLLIEDVFEGTSPKTYEILEKLARSIESMFKKNINGRLERVINPVWIAEFLREVDIPNKHKREIAKEQTRLTALKKYPWATGMVEDAYDAIGLLDAYITGCYDGDNTLQTPRLINTFIQANNHLYDFEIYSNKQTTQPQLQDILLASSNINIVRYNPLLTPDQNAKLATEIYKDPVVSEPIPKSNWTSLFCMLTETNPEEDNEFRMIAYNSAKRVSRTNFFEPLPYFDLQ